VNAPFDRTDQIGRLVERRERNPRTHTFAELADLYRQAGELGRALEVIEDGLHHHPHFLNARLVHARLLRELGRTDEASRAFELVLEIDSQNEVARRALSELGHGVADITPPKPPGARASVPGAAQWLARLDAEWRNGTLPDEPVEPPEPEEPGEVVDADELEPMIRPSGERRAGDDLETATLAQLYVSQGLIEQAIGIYERLLARDPYNARLAAALEDVRGRGKGSPEVSRPSLPPRPVEREGPRVGLDDSGAIIDESGSADVAPVPSAPQPTPEPDPDTPISEFLQALLEGRAQVEEGRDHPIDWPEWLRELGTRR
jgi:tetratricopeptide (TPR) repeat protein